MALDLGARRAFAVVIENQIVFFAMGHDSPRNGSSAIRSFFTARKTLCLAALMPRPSVLLISSIDRPS
jgi:hypothetical protein